MNLGSVVGGENYARTFRVGIKGTVGIIKSGADNGRSKRFTSVDVIERTDKLWYGGMKKSNTGNLFIEIKSGIKNDIHKLDVKR